jgi:hypothetical protein
MYIHEQVKENWPALALYEMLNTLRATWPSASAANASLTCSKG